MYLGVALPKCELDPWSDMRGGGGGGGGKGTRGSSYIYYAHWYMFCLLRCEEYKCIWARARILDTVANLATHFQKL